MLAAAAVEPVGHPALDEVVLLDVGVEQEQRDPAHLGDPDTGAQGTVAGQGEGDLGGGAVGLLELVQGQLVRIEHGVVLLLPAVPGQGLAEVAVPVEQADADQGAPRSLAALRWSPARMPSPPEYCGRAAVMPNSGRSRRRPRAAGRSAAGTSGRPSCRRPGRPRPRRGGRGSRGRRPVRRAARWARCPAGARGRRRPRPAFGVDGAEQVPGPGVPGPAQIAGQIAQRPEGFGEHGSDGESTDSLHKPPRRVRERRGVRPGIAADSTGADTVRGGSRKTRVPRLPCPNDSPHSGHGRFRPHVRPCRTSPRASRRPPGPSPAPPGPLSPRASRPVAGRGKKPAVSAARRTRTHVTSGVPSPSAPPAPTFPPVTCRRPRAARARRRRPGTAAGGRAAEPLVSRGGGRRMHGARTPYAPGPRARERLTRSKAPSASASRWERAQDARAPDPPGAEGSRPVLSVDIRVSS